jgi:hypothetical protein
MRVLTCGTVVALAAALAMPGSVGAQQADTTAAESTDGLRPKLGPHRFTPNPLTRDPFPRSYVRNSLGIGQASDLPILPTFELPNGDTLQAITGDLLFAILDFEYQQRIKEWMSFWVQVNIRGRLGNDVGSLLAEGVTLTSGYEIGWMFKFLESNRVALSATAEVANTSLTGVNILEFLKGVLDSTDVGLVQTTPVLRGGSSLRFAWAANAWLGVTATGNLSYGESADRSKANSASSNLSMAADVDLGPLINAPIGVVLAGSNVFSPDAAIEDIGDSQQGLLRVAYTGRDDFVIALDLTMVRAPLSGVTVTATAAKISMRYYF